MIKKHEIFRKDICININGRDYQMQIPTNLFLQDLLKGQLALTGTKRACGRGECGSCTVLMDDMPILSCLTLAVEADGKKIRTIEGEKDGDLLSDLQQAFIEHGAIQCGFCTPGMIMVARALLEKNPTPNIEEIKEAISGNICRCTGYEAIISAISQVSKDNARANNPKKRGNNE